MTTLKTAARETSALQRVKNTGLNCKFKFIVELKTFYTALQMDGLRKFQDQLN